MTNLSQSLDQDTAPQCAAADPRPAWLFVLPWSIAAIGGVNQVVLNLAREMHASAPYRPLIAINEWGRREPAHETHAALPVLRLWSPAPWTERRPLRGLLRYLGELPFILRRLTRLLREQQIAVVNVHYPGPSAFTWLLLRRTGMFAGSLVLSLHGRDIRSTHAATRWEYHLWRMLARGADAVVACSDALADESRDLLDLPTLRVVTIHNGVSTPALHDARRAHTPPAKQRARGRRYLLNIGTYEHKKGQDLLLDAYTQLAAERPDIDLIMVGRSGPVLADLTARIAALGLSERVHLYRDLPHGETLALLADAECFVLPSRNEGFALVLLEASAFGIPIVATDVCGVTELLEDGVTGRVVGAEDSAALLAALREVLAQPERAQAMAAAARLVVEQRFSWRAQCAAYVALAPRPGA